jgi:hypothetical protein
MKGKKAPSQPPSNTSSKQPISKPTSSKPTSNKPTSSNPPSRKPANKPPRPAPKKKEEPVPARFQEIPKDFHKYYRSVWVQRSVEENGRKGLVYCMDFSLLQPGWELQPIERGRVRTKQQGFYPNFGRVVEDGGECTPGTGRGWQGERREGLWRTAIWVWEDGRKAGCSSQVAWHAGDHL